MTFSLYDAFVPSCRQVIGGCLNVLAKAEAHGGIDLTAARLAPDMAGVVFQVNQVARHSAGAIEGVRAGRFSPGGAMPEATWDALKAELTGADAMLAALDPAEINGFIGGTTVFAFRDRTMPFTSENFLLSFSQPNFYFHATSLYAIFRNQGVALGKMDFMGRPRIAD